MNKLFHLFPHWRRLLSSVDSLCKQLGLRPGPTKRRSWSGSKPFDSLKVFRKLFKKLILKNVSRGQQHREKLPSMQMDYIHNLPRLRHAVRKYANATERDQQMHRSACV